MSHAIQNPFATPEGARRYHQGRPFHHPRALDKIFEVVGLDNVPIALDVACGTGLSTIALVDHAQLVIGIDPVEAMLRVPPHRVSAVYVCAAAEHVPVPSRSVDVATVSSGIHWFHQDAFFTEMAQVLRPGGWLAIYDHFFRGARDQEPINQWLKRSYLQRYPAPDRGPGAEKNIAAPDAFVQAETFKYDDPISFTHDDLVAYLMSQSNTIAPTAKGSETAEEIESWLRRETSPWFDPPTQQIFLFRGIAHCFQLRT